MTSHSQLHSHGVQGLHGSQMHSQGSQQVVHVVVQQGSVSQQGVKKSALAVVIKPAPAISKAINIFFIVSSSFKMY